MTVQDLPGKKISGDILNRFSFFHYVNKECPEWIEENSYRYEYNEDKLKRKLYTDCWVTRITPSQGCGCIEVNIVLILSIRDGIIKNARAAVEYIHSPGSYIMMGTPAEIKGGNFYRDPEDVFLPINREFTDIFNAINEIQ